MNGNGVIEVVANSQEESKILTRLAALGSLIKDHGSRILKANREVNAMIWTQRRGLALIRWVLLIPMIGTPFLMSYSTGQIVDGVRQHVSPTSLVWHTVALALGLIVSGALPLILRVLDRLAEYWAFTFIQQLQVTKVPNLDPVTYSDPNLKDKIQQVQERAVWRIMGFVQSQLLLARALALVLIAGWMLVSYNVWICALIVVAMVPSMALEALHAYRQFKIDERQGDWWRRFWENRSHILDSKTLAYLQVFGAAHWFAERFATQIAAAMKEYDDVEHQSILPRVFAMSLGMGAVVVATVILIQGLTKGELSLAQFIFNLGALTLLGTSLAEIASTIGQQFGQSFYVTSFQDVQALASRTHFPEISAHPTVEVRGISLELKNVRFGYPQGAGKIHREIIKGLSLSIPAGEKWALVGVNGAGKTTLNALMVRLFDPDSGEVLIGGVDARELTRSKLRSLVGCLPQHIQHYNLSVEEFIALGRTDEPIDSDRTSWAAKRSGAASFVDLYPNRYQQRLGRDYKNTEEPSGGQLQKLALASLLYMKAPLMVLDEPTAAIDPEAARDFWDTLLKETPGQTVIFSTHYFGAVRRADRIVVLDQGQVLVQGTHDDLIVTCAPYRALFESQARDYRTQS